MTYYDWDKIVANNSDTELMRIYREKATEPEDKVKAAIGELIKRGLLSPELSYIPKPEIEEFIVNVSEISNTKPNKKLAKYTITIIAVIIFIHIARLISLIMQYRLLYSTNEGTKLTMEMVYNNNIREVSIVIGYLFFFLLSAVFFLFWFKRAYDNLHKRILKCDFASGWAIGSWFVPIISLYRPYNIMKELVKKNNLIIQHRDKNLSLNTKTFYIGLWWICWIIANTIRRNSIGISSEADAFDINIFFTIFDIILEGLGIVLAIFTILMIKRFSENEEILFKNEIGTA